MPMLDGALLQIAYRIRSHVSQLRALSRRQRICNGRSESDILS